MEAFLEKETYELSEAGFASGKKNVGDKKATVVSRVDSVKVAI
jgi:hypothetical protein